MTTLVTDDFNRANAATLGANYTRVHGTDDIGVASNQAASGSPILSGMVYSATSMGTQDHWVQIQLGTVDTVTDNGFGVFLRSTTSGGSSLILIQGNTVETRVYRYNGSYTQLGVDGPACASGDILKIGIQGMTLTVERNGSAICGSPITDASAPSGTYIGVWSAATGAFTADNLSAGDFSAPPAADLVQSYDIVYAAQSPSIFGLDPYDLSWFGIPAALVGQRNTITSLDLAVQLAQTLTASIDAAVQAPRSATVALDLAAQSAVSATTSLDAALQATATLTAALQTAVQTTPSANASLDLAVQAARSALSSIDAALQIARAATASIDLNVQAATAVGASIDLQVQAGTSLAAAIQLAVLASLSAGSAVDFAVQRPLAATSALGLAAQQALAAATAIDLAVQAARSAAASIDLQVQAGTSVALALDVAVQAGTSAQMQIGLAVQTSVAASAVLDLVVGQQRGSSAALETAVLHARTAVAGLSAYVFDAAAITSLGPRRIREERLHVPQRSFKGLH